jgi:2-succinyl-6-hydroxy-2,4-cyclohexadiene-1-carboxylate synthase
MPTDVDVANGALRVWQWAGPSPPIVFLHGFGGSGLDVEALIHVMAPKRAVIAPDLWGHGEGASSHVPAITMTECAHQLRAVLDILKVRDAVLVGYSMGARLALHLALQAPVRWNAMVLIGGHAGIRDPTERKARHQWDQAMAATARHLGQPAFANHWEQIPIIASQQHTPEPWRTRLYERRRRADVNALARALESLGAGTMASLWEQLSTLNMPALVVAGQQDPKYVKLGQDLVKALPNATASWIPNCGHAPHLEAAPQFSEVLSHFLARHAPPWAQPQGRS